MSARPVRGSGVTRWIAILVLAAFAVPVGVRFAGFADWSTSIRERAYNEGWNVVYAHVAAAGGLYRAPPSRFATNYPPVSFHLVAAAGRVLGNFNFAGRLISIAALFWVSLCAAFIVNRAARDLTAAAFGALFCFAWFNFFAPSCVGVNDPQMLGHAIVMTGAALYAASRRSTALLAASAIVLAIGVFTKHNLIVFPLAVALDLLLRSRRRFAIWAGAGALAVAVLAVLTVWIDGPYALQHLLIPRRYLPAHAVFISGIFLRVFFPGLALCATWCFKRARHSEVRFLAFALALSLCSGAGFAGGLGVFVNVFYETLIVIAIIAALVLAEFLAGVPGLPARCAALIVVPVAFSAMPVLSGLYSTAPSRESLARDDRAYAADLAYMKSRPGPAICFDLQLCFDAGKPLAYEKFVTSELIAAGRFDEQVLANEIQAGTYSVIQSEEGLVYFPPRMLKALHARYRLDRRSEISIFYVPIDQPHP